MQRGDSSEESDGGVQIKESCGMISGGGSGAGMDSRWPGFAFWGAPKYHLPCGSIRFTGMADARARNTEGPIVVFYTSGALSRKSHWNIGCQLGLVIAA